MSAMMNLHMEVSTNDFPPIYHINSQYSEIDGCVTHLIGESSIEVWGEDISEHYLITIRVDQLPKVDYVFLVQSV